MDSPPDGTLIGFDEAGRVVVVRADCRAPEDFVLGMKAWLVDHSDVGRAPS